VTLVAVVISAGVAVASSFVTGMGAPIGGVQGAVSVAMPSPAAGGGSMPSAPPTAPVDIAEPSRSPTPVAVPSASVSPTAPAPDTLSGYRSPLPHGRLTLPFGPSRWGSRIVDGEAFHDGVDLATFCGDRVVAAHTGTVLASGRRYDEQMGWVGDLGPYLARLDSRKLWSSLPIVVVVDDGNGYRSVYAHFGKVVVKAGDAVKAGQLLGYEGRTGRASGCHLHYGLFSPL
jgi:murein DD-endopeptidase MepM/ murein hydrolase activator NlpD